MTAHQIHLVKKTWRLLRKVDPHLLANVFYKRLFLRSASARSLFGGPMEAQYEKFVAMLSFLVAHLDQPETLLGEAIAMARRHVTYGVTPAHYRPVGEALLWTIQKGLGPDWNDDVRQAWQACYELLTKAMLEQETGDSDTPTVRVFPTQSDGQD